MLKARFHLRKSGRGENLVIGRPVFSGRRPWLGDRDVNARHGDEPGVSFYTHVSDQFSPYHTKVIAATASEAPHVLDGLLNHQSGLRIEEHYTDTGGATDPVFGLCHVLGFRFAPRMRGIKDRRLHVFPGSNAPPILAPLVGGFVDGDHIAANWSEILRLATSIRSGAVQASAMLKKLSGYPRQNGLAVALRDIGRIERSLFMLGWYSDPELRRRTGLGLNKGEARNMLARAIFFNRLGELRDRSFENQAYRASGLNLIVAAIILWNTRYLAPAFAELARRGHDVSPELIRHVAPLGWQHIALTGDYSWNLAAPFAPDALRTVRNESSILAASQEELRKTQFFSLIHPEDLDEFKRRIRALLEGREPQFEIENQFVAKSGATVWVRNFVSAIPDAEGRPAQIIALVTDITSRIGAQQELRAVDVQLRLMIDHAPAAVAMFDRNMRYVA